MTLVPYAGSEDIEKKKKGFNSLALLSLRTEFNSLASKYKIALAESNKLRARLHTALDRAADLERIINRAAGMLNGPRMDDENLPWIPEANRICMVVADHFELSPVSLFGRARDREHTVPRHIAMYLVHNDLGASIAATGRFFGGRDHTTVIHAVKSVTRRTKMRYANAEEDLRKIKIKLQSASRAVESEAAPLSRPPSEDGAASL